MRSLIKFLAPKRLSLVILAMLTCLTVYGCGSSSDSTPPADQPTDVLNSAFYGAYAVNITIGDCPAEDFSVTIGNDLSMAGEDDYIYLSENVQSFEGAGFSITRDENTITIVEDDDDYHQTIIITFADDLASATLSGSIEDSDPEECSGAVSGTATLVTRTPAQISFDYLQFRSYPDSDDNKRAAWVELTQDGLPIPAANILSASLYKGDVTDANKVGEGTNPQAFSTGEYLSGVFNPESSAVDFDEAPVTYAGLGIGFTREDIYQDEYVFVAQVRENEQTYSVSKRISYPGDTESSVVKNILISETTENDLVISWDTLTDEADQSLRISILKTDFASLNKELMVVKVASDDQTSTITIPAAIMTTLEEKAAAIEEYGILAVQIQTRQFTEDSMNFARGYSELVEIQGSSTGTIVDNTPFYGAYGVTLNSGECQETFSVTVGDDITRACIDDYLYLPPDQLSATLPCGTITRNGDSLDLSSADETETFVLDFDQDKDNAVLSGTKTHGLCSGEFTGDASIITRNPLEVQFSFIKSNFNLSGYFGQTISMALLKNDLPAQEVDIEKFEIRNNGGITELTTENIESIFQTRSYLFGTYDGENLSIENTVSWAGIVLQYIGLGLLSEGDYTFYATINHNGTSKYTVSSRVSFPGVEAIPVLSGASFLKEIDGENVAFNLTWELPIENLFDELFVSIFIKNNSDDSKQYLLTITIDSKDGVESITLPDSIEEMILDAENELSYNEVLGMELQTRKYSNDGKVVSSGYFADTMRIVNITATDPSK